MTPMLSPAVAATFTAEPETVDPAAGAVMPEGQPDLQVRPFHPGRLVIDEAGHDAMEEAIGRLEAGDQELLDALLNVVRQK